MFKKIVLKRGIENNQRDIIENYTNKYSRICDEKNRIDSSLYGNSGVKRGLRDISGKGVLAGITNISLIQSYIISPLQPEWSLPPVRIRIQSWRPHYHL